MLPRFTPTHVGKTFDVPPSAVGHYGSPPRTWGRLAASPERFQGVRFTPTHVGKTQPPPLPSWAIPVHPHARGEDASRDTTPAAFTGSPPRTWGRPPVVPVAMSGRRFTPTHVGKTSTRQRRAARTGGSPPRTWGRPQQSGRGCPRRRFTPTHVGKTLEM